jgi:hypothetical protein
MRRETTHFSLRKETTTFDFSFLYFKKESNNQPWQTLHLEPATSFGGALSPPPKSHPLGSQGKMALQNSEPTK